MKIYVKEDLLKYMRYRNRSLETVHVRRKIYYDKNTQ